MCTFFASFNLKILLMKTGKKTNKTQKCSWRDESDSNQPARDQTLFLTKAKKTFFMGCDCHRSLGPPRLSSSLNTAPPFPPLQGTGPKLPKANGCACGAGVGVVLRSVAWRSRQLALPGTHRPASRFKTLLRTRIILIFKSLGFCHF